MSYIQKESFLDKLLYMGYLDENDEIAETAENYIADVIERSKINKAISEIEKEIARYGTKGMYYCGLNYAIKVLKEI